jgi:hypothetical protein
MHQLASCWAPCWCMPEGRLLCCSRPRTQGTTVPHNTASARASRYPELGLCMLFLLLLLFIAAATRGV